MENGDKGAGVLRMKRDRVFTSTEVELRKVQIIVGSR